MGWEGGQSCKSGCISACTGGECVCVWGAVSQLVGTHTCWWTTGWGGESTPFAWMLSSHLVRCRCGGACAPACQGCQDSSRRKEGGGGGACVCVCVCVCVHVRACVWGRRGSRRCKEGLVATLGWWEGEHRARGNDQTFRTNSNHTTHTHARTRTHTHTHTRTAGRCRWKRRGWGQGPDVPHQRPKPRARRCQGSKLEHAFKVKLGLVGGARGDENGGTL
jgi:hypothetical protein